MTEKILKTFDELTMLANTKKFSLQYIESDIAYYVFFVDEIGTIYQSNIYKSAFLVVC